MTVNRPLGWACFGAGATMVTGVAAVAGNFMPQFVQNRQFGAKVSPQPGHLLALCIPTAACASFATAFGLGETVVSLGTGGFVAGVGAAVTIFAVA